MKHVIKLPKLSVEGKGVSEEAIGQTLIGILNTLYPDVTFHDPYVGQYSYHGLQLGVIRITTNGSYDNVVWVAGFPTINVVAGNLTEGEICDRLVKAVCEVLEMQYHWLGHRRIQQPVDLPKMEVFTND